MKIASSMESGPGFEVQVSEMELSPEDRVAIYVVAKDDTEDAMVLLEGETTLGIEQLQPAPKVYEPLKQVKYFFTGALKRGQKFVVYVSSAVQNNVSLSVLFLSKQIKKAWKDLPCKGCKLTVKVVAHAVLAHVGVPFPGILNHTPFPSLGDHATMLANPHAPGVAINASQKSAILQLGTAIDNSELGRFLSKLSFWDLIKGAFDAFDWFFKALDEFYAWPCKKIGCCPP